MERFGIRNGMAVGIVLLFIGSAFTPTVGSKGESSIFVTSGSGILRSSSGKSSGRLDSSFNVQMNKNSNDPLPLGSDDSWWNSHWLFRKLITIDHTKVGSSLVDFPVLISLSSDAEVAARAQTTGHDIAFILFSDNTTKLNHEIEWYDYTNGNLIAWVNVTSLSSAVDTKIWMYYGNPDAGDQQNIVGTWDSHYVYVQHLNETTGTVYDSTQYHNDGTSHSTGSQNRSAPGKIDGAFYFFRTKSEYVDTANSSSLYNTMKNAFTVEAWSKNNVSWNNNFRSVVTKDKSGGSSEFWFGWSSGNRLDFKFNAGTDRIGNTVVTDSNWHYLVGDFDGTYLSLYLDGSSDNTPVSVAKVVPSDGSVNLGVTKYWGNNYYGGTLDEVRISNVARSSSWLRTSYQNQNDPGSFISVGTGEQTPYPVLSSPYPANNTLNIPITLLELTFTLIDYQSDLMSYTVSITPDVIGGPQSDDNIASGTTIHLPIINHPLNHNTQYSWQIDLTDGTYWTNTTLTFETNPAPMNWWDTSWPFRKLITIDHTKVGSSLVDFPVLISLSSDAEVAARAQTTGHDIVFILFSDNTTKLNHEIEWYDHTNGNLIAWVNVTSLSSAVDTKIWMYYGNPDAGDQQNIVGTWDSHYVYVQHLNETTGTVYDSTQYHNDGVSHGSVNRSAPGKMDGAFYFDRTANNNYVDSTNSTSLYNAMKGAFTVEAWLKANNLGTWRSAITKDKGGTGKTSEFWFGFGGNNKLDFKFNSGADQYGNTSITDSNWHYFVGEFNEITMRLYLDGNPDNSPVSVAKVAPSNGSVNLGITKYWGDNYYGGTLDEVRISDVARSSNWLRTSYQNQNNPATFFMLGSEQRYEYTLALTIEGTGSGTIQASPTGPYYYGAAVTIWANVSIGSSFTEFTGDLTGATTPQTLSMNGNKTVAAHFTLNSYTLTVTVDPAAGGGIDAAPAPPYHYNDVVTLTANANSGYTFDHWSGDLTGSTNPTTVIMDSNKLITATFVGIYSIALHQSWNLISIPCNDTIAKANIRVRNNSVYYTWSDAVIQGIILDSVYDFNRTLQSYTDPSTITALAHGRGYWLWAYYECSLILTSPATEGTNLSSLQPGWNIMGLACNVSLLKSTIIIHHGTNDYTWDQASGGGDPIILGYVYSWSSTNQMYTLSDTFEPGGGYWMYVYKDCTLKEGGS